MVKESTLQVKMDSDVLKRAESLYSSMGTSLAEVLRLFTLKSVEVNGIPYAMSAPVKKNGQRLGIAKGKFKVPDDIDVYNDEIEEMFYGGGEE
ncbi:MAG: hypothetical protein LUI14_06270 [Lachnospiraceae bacterium]|nr:hypothetical protein [Lachnospiraceae bacterium]